MRGRIPGEQFEARSAIARIEFSSSWDDRLYFGPHPLEHQMRLPGRRARYRHRHYQFPAFAEVLTAFLRLYKRQFY